MNAQEKINNTKSLDELCETLNSIVSELGEAGGELTIDQVVDVCSLPTFGGNDPKKTSEVWSWDATQVLVADGSAWSVEDRCVYGRCLNGGT